LAFCPVSQEELERILAGFPGAISFDGQVDQAWEYQRLLNRRKSAPPVLHLARELAERLEQVNVLIKSVYSLLFEYRKMMGTQDPKVLADYMGSGARICCFCCISIQKGGLAAIRAGYRPLERSPRRLDLHRSLSTPLPIPCGACPGDNPRQRWCTSVIALNG
jgi:hypothetical protein